MLDIASEYRAQGWYPVPIPFREKGPRLDGWQNLRLDGEQLAQHFNGAPQNIGIILGAASGHIVDGDLDQPECLPFAGWILPTTRIFGRPGNINSHWLFRSVTEQTKVEFFVMAPGSDGRPRKHTFVELRANGHQTVFPPSTHKTGEPIRWVNHLPLTEIDFTELERRAARIAAGAALAQAWPREKGSRHDCELALAGILLRADFTNEDAERFIRTITAIANTENGPQRAKNVVATTKARLDSDQPVTGWRTLSKLLNKPDLLAKVPTWLGYSPLNQEEVTEEEIMERAAIRAESAPPDVIPPPAPLQAVCVATVGVEHVRWLWHPRIPIGKLTMIEGDPGVGKSFLTAALAAAVSRGAGITEHRPLRARQRPDAVRRGWIDRYHPTPTGGSWRGPEPRLCHR